MLTNEQLQEIQDRINSIFPEGLEFFVVLHDPVDDKSLAFTSTNPPDLIYPIVREVLNECEAKGEYQVIDTDAPN